MTKIEQLFLHFSSLPNETKHMFLSRALGIKAALEFNDIPFAIYLTNTITEEFLQDLKTQLLEVLIEEEPQT